MLGGTQREPEMKSNLSCFIILLIVFFFSMICVSGIYSDDQTLSYEETHRQTLAKNPDGVTFTIRIGSNQTRFQQGEIVSIELSFSSNMSNTYSLHDRRYDRSGRMSTERFYADPAEGVCDPLSVLVFGFGGLSSGPIILSEKPHRIPLEINEWLRFDTPGHFRLYVTSNRISRDNPDPNAKIRILKYPVTSNIIEFDIIPAYPKWAKKTLRDALHILDSKDPEIRSKKREASRSLRFLNTKESARQMIRRFWGRECDYETQLSLGVIATPYPIDAIREMERRLAAPDQPVSSQYLQTLAWLHFRTIKREPLPVYVPGDAENNKRFREIKKNNWEEIEVLNINNIHELSLGLTRKRGKCQ